MEHWDNWKQQNLFQDDVIYQQREVDLDQGRDVQSGQYSPLFSGRRSYSGSGEAGGQPRDYYSEGTSSAPTEMEGTWRSRLPPTRPRNEGGSGAHGVRIVTPSWIENYRSPVPSGGRLSGRKPPGAPRRTSRRDTAREG